MVTRSRPNTPAGSPAALAMELANAAPPEGWLGRTSDKIREALGSITSFRRRRRGGVKLGFERLPGRADSATPVRPVDLAETVLARRRRRTTRVAIFIDEMQELTTDQMSAVPVVPSGGQRTCRGSSSEAACRACRRFRPRPSHAERLDYRAIDPLSDTDALVASPNRRRPSHRGAATPLGSCSASPAGTPTPAAVRQDRRGRAAGPDEIALDDAPSASRKANSNSTVGFYCRWNGRRRPNVSSSGRWPTTTANRRSPTSPSGSARRARERRARTGEPHREVGYRLRRSTASSPTCARMADYVRRRDDDN
jgi:hypothetical protein